MNDLAKNIVLWIVIAVVLLAVFSNFSTRAGAVPRRSRIPTFLEQVKNGQVDAGHLQGDTHHAACARTASSSWPTTPRPTTPR